MRHARRLLVGLLAAALISTFGVIDPVSATERARHALAERTASEARAAAIVHATVAPAVAQQPDAVAVAEGEIVPGEGGSVDAPEVAASVEFSGHEVDETLAVIVSQLPASAAEVAASEAGGVVVSAPIDISATTAAGDAVTSFPADPTIVDHPDGTSVVTEVDPGVALEFAVDEAALADLDPASLRILTREVDGEPWAEIPSYFDAESGTVKGEIDHLSQFVVIGTPFVPPPGPRIVLDPDDDVGHTAGPNGPMTELPVNVELANQVAAALSTGCLADVVVTRPEASPAFLSTATRAGIAAAQSPVLTVTLAFNANVGYPWGTESTGGSIAYSRGGSADNAVRASLVAQLPAYTGRPARGASSASYPYAAFDALPGAVAHLETLFLDHNYDRPVIDNGFGSIVDGVFTGLGVWLEAQGYDCTDPVTGGWPAPPSQAELERWRTLGYQNFLTFGADPVSLSTGNLVEDEPIFTLTGVGDQVIDLTLVYNSLDGRESRVGVGWSFGLGARAQRFDDGSVLVVRGDGASVVFDADGAGGFVAADGVHQTLALHPDGRLLLTAATGQSWLFDTSDAEGIGELVAQTDRQGNTITLGYATADGDDRFLPLSSITDEAGQVVRVGADAAGRVSTFTHPDGRVWTLGYDAAGDLTSITGPDGRARTFSYDSAHRMLTATDAGGVTYLVNEFDSAGRVVKQWDADGNLRTFEYRITPGAGGSTIYTDNEGVETVYRFDARSRITEIEDALGGVKAYEYDADDQVTSFTDERGSRWRYEYDGAGNILTQTLPDGTRVRSTFTPTGETASVTDQLGRVTAFTVDASGLTTAVLRPDGLPTSSSYDGHGDVIATVDAAGRTTSYAYDARGNLVAVTDPLGRTTTIAWDAANRVTSVTDPGGGTTTFTWDDGDNLTARTDATGATTRFAYDAHDHPVSRTTATGAVTEYEWDDLFRLVAITDPEGGTTRYGYDTEDELTSVTDPLGARVILTLDELSRPVVVTDATGGEWRREFDAAGNVVQVTDPRGAVTQYAYDELGRLTHTTDAGGGVWRTAYDDGGRVVSSTDPLGAVTGYRYDVLDRVVQLTDAAGEFESYGYDAVGNLTRVVDRRGQQTTYSFDAVGQLTAWGGPLGTGATYRYDVRGDLVAITDPLGNATTYAYDAVGRATLQVDPTGARSTVAYDADGRVTRAVDPNGHATAYDYDLAGRLVEAVDPLGAITAYAYDAAGRLTEKTDAAGTATEYRYDAMSRLTSVEQAATSVVTGPLPADVGVTTAYDYDSVGNLTRVTGPTGAVTAYDYDLLGRVTAETDPVGGVWRYAYDAAGRVTREVDAAGRATDYAYTARSDVASIAYADGTRVRFEYDAAQNPLVMSDSLGTTGWVYDAAERLVRQTDALGQVVASGYDAASRRTSVTLPTGTVGFSFDPRGLPTRQTSPWGSLDYAYDPAGNLETVTRSTGVVTDYGYDAADRITSIDHTTPTGPRVAGIPASTVAPDGDGGPLAECTEAADYLDDRTVPGTGIHDCVATAAYLRSRTLPAAVEGLQPGQGIAFDYSYDELGNVTSETRVDGTRSSTRTFDFDRLSRLTGSTSSTGETSTYAYDRASNRIAAATTGGGRTDATRATYDAAGRVLTQSDDSGSTTFGYDANGNRIRMTDAAGTTRYEYTAADQLTRVVRNGSDTTTRYDGLGRALVTTERAAGGDRETREWVFDGWDAVGVDDTRFGATALVRDVAGEVALEGSSGAGGSTWNLADRSGSVVGQARSRVTQLAGYGDWGAVSYASSGWDAVAGYTGELSSTSSGLVGFHARSYDPGTGSWLQADPYRGIASDPSSQHRYGYVGANPVTDTDWYGFVSLRMQHEGGRTPAPSLLTSMGRQEAALVARLDPTGKKQQDAAKNPRDSSNNSQRHTDWGPLLTVLDIIGTAAGFAAFFPGPQQPVLAAIAGIAGAAASFIRCATGGLLSPDCIVDVIFAALGPLGKGMKGVVGPIVKQALGGVATVVKKAPTPAVVSRAGVGPVKQGAAGVDQVAADIEAAGGKILGREVTFVVGDVRTRPDLFVELPNGTKAVVEVKTGSAAAMTPNQRKGFDVIRQGNAIPVGKNALEAELPVGEALEPTQVWIVHQTWPVTP